MSKDAIGRPLVFIVIAAYLCASLSPDRAAAQTSECGYDRKAPSLASARGSFQEFDFACAEREVSDLLRITSLDAGIQADAHALLAAIYFQTLPDNQSRREKVIEEFRRTYSLRPNWSGRPDVQTPAFQDLMSEAKRQVEQLRQRDKPAPPSGKTAAKPAPELRETQTAGKGGSKKTWIYVVVGAAAVGVAALALGGGGGGGNGGGGGDLPDFPPPPAGKNR